MLGVFSPEEFHLLRFIVLYEQRDHAAIGSYSIANQSKEHEVALHELSFVPPAEDILVDYEEGESIEVEMHDGSHIVLRKVENDYDPTDRAGILCMLEEANRQGELVTGLLYINPGQKSLFDFYNLVDEPLNRLTEDQLRPPKETIIEVNAMMF